MKMSGSDYASSGSTVIATYYGLYGLAAGI